MGAGRELHEYGDDDAHEHGCVPHLRFRQRAFGEVDVDAAATIEIAQLAVPAAERGVPNEGPEQRISLAALVKARSEDIFENHVLVQEDRQERRQDGVALDGVGAIDGAELPGEGVDRVPTAAIDPAQAFELGSQFLNGAQARASRLL